MAVVRHVFMRSALILVFYLVLGNPLNPSFALWLDKGTDCCLALAAGSELKTFSPPQLSIKRKVVDKRHLTLEQISSAASLRLIKLTRDILLAALLLQCNDISLNPGPNVKLTCPRRLKTLRRNQGRGLCRLCKSHYHLKRLDVDFEKTTLCWLWNLPPGKLSFQMPYWVFWKPEDWK